MHKLAVLLFFSLMIYGAYRVNFRLMQWSSSEQLISGTDAVAGSRILVIPGSGKAYTERPNYQFNGRVSTAAGLLLKDTLLRVLVSGFHDGHEYAETTDLANALTAKGIEPSRILFDSSAHDTFQTILNLTKPDTVQTYIFVSQSEHLARTLWMARRAGLNAKGIIATGWPKGTPEWRITRERMAAVKARFEVWYYLITGTRYRRETD